MPWKRLQLIATYKRSTNQQGKQFFRPKIKYTLKQLQESVGGYIERVLPPVESDVPKGLVFLVDEEGLLKPKLLNALATAMLGAPVVGDLAVIDQELMK